MALYARITCLNIVHPRRIQYVAARGMLDVLASRASRNATALPYPTYLDII